MSNAEGTEDMGPDDGPIVLPDGASCGTCAYSRLFALQGEIKRIRVCKRFPPVPTVIPSMGPDGRPVLNITPQNPVVQDSDVCFEWDQAEVNLISAGQA